MRTSTGETGETGEVDVDRAIQAASRRLGYSSLRRKQEEAIKEFAVGKDVLFVCSHWWWKESLLCHPSLVV